MSPICSIPVGFIALAAVTLFAVVSFYRAIADEEQDE